MPLPKPSKNQEKDEFISHCMSNDTMNSEYPDQKQRLAICHSQYKRAKKTKGSVKWEDQVVNGSVIVY
ncbi:MAG: hypothetical protein AABY22_22380 [Nanoarchaeota archaeon]